MDRDQRACLASIQKHIDGVEMKQLNSVTEVRSAMEAQLSKLKVRTETAAKENLEQMAELMDCIQKVNVEGNESVSRLRDATKAQMLDQKKIFESSIRLISDSIANKNMDHDTKMSFISRKQVHADHIAKQFCM